MAVIRQASSILLPLLAWWGMLVATAVWLDDRVVARSGPARRVDPGHLPRRVEPGTQGDAPRTVLLTLLWPLFFAAPAVALHAWRDLSLGGFGLVPGSSAAGDGLCDWLRGHVQAAAGLPLGEPLTFGMLREDMGHDGSPVGIELRMITTTSRARAP
jgi:hypothetical protein